jgi:16S rRNA (cytosine967-C5)-methyltransferase
VIDTPPPSVSPCGRSRDLAAPQRALLEKAAPLLKPAGRICYSTCSIQNTENQDMIQAFLAAHDQFKLTKEHLMLPSSQPFDHDGAYAALLRIRERNG